MKNDEIKNEEVKKIKVNLLRDVTFPAPDGVKAKGEMVETNESTADWLTQVGATEKPHHSQAEWSGKLTASQAKRIKSQKSETD